MSKHTKKAVKSAKRLVMNPRCETPRVHNKKKSSTKKAQPSESIYLDLITKPKRQKTSMDEAFASVNL